MKWLKRLIHRWNQEGRELWEEDIPAPKTSRHNRGLIRASNSISGSDLDGDEGLNISVRKAIGGKIVTFRQYDERNDRNHYKLYVIPDDLDFDKELGKLITLESMRM
jgi:hypothetical protein